MSIRWLKDGRGLTSTPNLRIHDQIPGMSILDLQRLTAADSGTYTCIASTRAGTTRVSKEMVVYGQYVLVKLFQFVTKHDKAKQIHDTN